MKFTSGMWINGKASNNPINTTRKNLNVVLSKNTGSWTVEDGFTFHSLSFNARGLVPNGAFSINADRILVFSIAGTSSEIGVIETDGTYVTVSNSNIWNFSVDSPIHGEWQLNFKGQVIVAFTDRDRNPPRIVNLDNLPNPLTADSVLMFPKYTEPAYSLTEIEVGGVLASGAKWITGRYIDKEGNRTRWFKTSKPMFITEDTKSEGFDNYDGCEPNTTTTKAINVVFNNPDSAFVSIEVALIEKIDGVITAKIVTVTSVDSNVEVTITGNENLGSVSIADVFEENGSFDRVYALTQLNNTLYFGNVRESTIDEFQKHANAIRLNFVSKRMEQGDFTGSVKTASGYLNRGLKHGETYAWYFNFIMLDGSRSRGFHIPGREPTNINIPIDGSSAILIADERISCRDVYNAGINSGANLNYMLEDLAVDNLAKYFHTRDTSMNPNGVTNMGFWENESEEYPNTDDFLVVGSSGIPIADLRGQKVRHHKLPTVKKIKEKLYPTDPQYGATFMDVLGVEIDPTSLYIPQEILDKIQGWELTYAERTVTNSSIIGQDILMFGSNHGIGTPIRSNAGNWNTLNLSNSQTQDILRSEARFHDFDLIRYKPSTTPSFIRNNIKLIKQTELYDVQGTYNSNDYKAVLVSDFGRKTHYTQSSGDNRTEIPILRDEVRQITNYKFIPNNVVDGSLDNRFLEEYIHANITSAQGIELSTNNRSNFFAGSSINQNTRSFIQIDNVNILFGPVEETFLTDLCVLYKDMYSGFYNQKLVSTGYKFDKNVSTAGIAVYGGDVFVGFHSYAAFGIRDQWDYNSLSSQSGLKAFKRYLHEGISNTELRHYDSLKGDSYYYPFGGNASGMFVNIGFNYYRDLEPNNFLYNKDYSSIDNLFTLVPFDPNEEFTTEHSNRIYRSLNSDPEDQTSNWRAVKINDYYEMPKNMGEIIALQGVDDRLVINQRWSSFVTIGNEKMSTTQGEVNIGTGDIFRVKPEELITDKNGYGGVQHKYGTLLTKYGYVMIDAEQGKVFIYKNGQALKELSRENAFALHDFFRDGCASTIDNPFNDSGFTVGFDEKFERLLISKKRFFFNEFGQELLDGVYGVGHYIKFMGSKWIYVNEASNIYQIIYEGDVRFWDSDSWTISYSFDFDCWASFHSYTPDFLLNTRNKLVSFKDSKVFRHNHTNKGIYYNSVEVNPSYITPTFVSPYRTEDKKALISALFGSISMNTEMYDPDGVLIKEKSISRVMAYNSYQSTGDVEMVYYDNNLTHEENYLLYNIRNAKNTFTFNKLKDLVVNRRVPFVQDYESVDSNIDANKPFYLRRKMIDKFLVVKLLYNNEKIGNLQYDLHFGDISMYTKPVLR